MTARYIGARYDSPQYNDYKNKKYCVADIATSYDINDNLELFASVDNIFDTAYEPVRGYLGLERTVMIGLKGKM